MKKEITKPTKLVALIMLLVLTLSAVTATNISALNNQKITEWKVELMSEGGDGVTKDDIWININGTEGSTGWINVGSVYLNWIEGYGSKKVYFDAPEVGEILSIDVKVDGTDGWYPSLIFVYPGVVRGCHLFRCGKWVDNGEVVNFSSSSEFLLEVNTADVLNAGTDRNVYATLVDEKGVRSAKTNLSDLVDEINAFERGDSHFISIGVPENFGSLHHIDFELSGGSSVSSGWKLGSVKVHIAGYYKTFSGIDYVEVNQWGDKGEPITVYF